MPKLLEGKRAVVTGSTRGIGRAIAVDLAANGASVVVNGTDPARVAAVEADIVAADGTAVGVHGSVADLAVCEALVARCVATFGGIDLLVHNAGIVRDRTLLKMTPEEFDEVVAVHLRGAWGCAKFAALAMAPAGRGHILNVTAGAGLYGSFGQCNYAAAKGGINGLTRALTVELGDRGIRVNALSPVAMTDMTQTVVDRVAALSAASGVPSEPPPFPPAEDVAPLVTFLASDAAPAVTGQIFEFDGRELALWTHPEQVGSRELDRPWQQDDFADYFGSGALLQSLHPGRWGGGVRASLAAAAGPQPSPTTGS
jgi:NAD(P)-dependent dehydrogenase (short-subunit alcohol dehydrogenase family)